MPEIGEIRERQEIGYKDDNRLENLEIMTNRSHHKDHSKGYQDGYRKGFTDGRSAKIRQLELQVRELQIKR